MADFDGNLNPDAGWPEIPRASDRMQLLGGEGGPLNAQALALAARSNLLRAEVYEALRRSYEDAGLTMRQYPESFKNGGTLTTATSVLLDEASGKAYSGAGPFPQTVDPDTDPTSVGFVDESGKLLTDLISAEEISGRKNAGTGALYGNTLIIGDSITEGVGASTYAQSYAYLFGRSFFNHQDNGWGDDGGLMYETNANMLKAWSEVGMPALGGGGSSGISFVNQGLVDKQLRVPAGEYFYIKTREIASIGFFYDGTVTTCTSATVSLNGVAIGVLALGGTSVGEHSGFVGMPFGKNTELTDEIRITADNGDLYISGVTSHRSSTVGGGLYLAPRGGWSFDDFNTPPKIAELSEMLLFNKSVSLQKVVVVALGTNSIYQSGRAQTPDDYVSSLDALVGAIQATSANLNFVISVPPRANPALYPVVLTDYTHDDYVTAIVEYATDNRHDLLRLDRTVLSLPPYAYYSDGLHPNSQGHSVVAAKLCELLQIPYNSYVKTIDFNVQRLKRFEIDIADFPGSGGAPTIKWVDLQRNVERVVSVRLRNSSGVEVQAEAVRDIAGSVGVYWHNTGSATRFFYPNAGGFATNTGYYAATGILTSGSTGVTLVVDYI